jgi:putative Holliday junction resolvase
MFAWPAWILLRRCSSGYCPPRLTWLRQLEASAINIPHYIREQIPDDPIDKQTVRTTGRFFFNFARKSGLLGRIIAIDYGSKRCGLAVTDPGQMIASPMDTVPTHELMNYLQAYFEKEPVDLVVVGRPRQMDNTDSEVMKLIHFFVGAFKKRFKAIPVEWMDERFTSKLAKEAMIAGGMKQKDRRIKGNVDRVSAALILQFFLEKRNNMSS